MNFVCPKPAALTTIDKVTCPENYGQIQRLVFQRAGYTFDAPATDILLLASWTPLIAAVDGTKVVSTPFIEGFTIGQSEPITTGGGDNSTVDGVEIIEGSGPITAGGTFRGVPASIIAKLRLLMGEAINPGDLVMYMINQYGKIICTEVAVGDKYTGIPLVSLFVPNAGNEGLNTRDASNFRFSLVDGWRDSCVILTPGFNAKTAL